VHGPPRSRRGVEEPERAQPVVEPGHDQAVSAREGAAVTGPVGAAAREVPAAVELHHDRSALVPRVRGDVEVQAVLRRLRQSPAPGPAVGLTGEVLWAEAAADAGAKCVDGGEVVAGQLEVEDVETPHDPGRCDRPRDGPAALLEMPAQYPLRREPAARGRDERVMAILQIGPSS
jgi:hypothetical protein